MTLTTPRTLTPMVSIPLCAWLLAGCALRPPVDSGGPALARRQGQIAVQLSLVRQACDQSQEPDFPGDDLTEATVEVEVRNAGAAPLMIRRDAFRLVTAAPDSVALPPMTLGAAEPLIVGGGAARTFQLRFMNRGSLRCASSLVLAPNAAVIAGERPLNVGAIRFQPERG